MQWVATHIHPHLPIKFIFLLQPKSNDVSLFSPGRNTSSSGLYVNFKGTVTPEKGIGKTVNSPSANFSQFAMEAMSRLLQWFAILAKMVIFQFANWSMTRGCAFLRNGFYDVTFLGEFNGLVGTSSPETIDFPMMGLKAVKIFPPLRGWKIHGKRSPKKMRLGSSESCESEVLEMVAEGERFDRLFVMNMDEHTMIKTG